MQKQDPKVGLWRNHIINSQAVTESIHTRKEIFHSGHPTDIQHH